MSAAISPQEHGRELTRRLCEKYGWEPVPGSGDQYQLPSDTAAGLDQPTAFQIEIKTQIYHPERGSHSFRLNLVEVWEKLAAEAILKGRIPLLVVAVTDTWHAAVCAYPDAEEWGLVQPRWLRMPVSRWWSDNPARWDTGLVIVRRYPFPGPNPPHKALLVPFWMRCPVEWIPGLVRSS